MSCSTCKEVKVIAPDHSGLQYSLVPGVTSVEGRLGKLYPINQPLIPKPHTPRGGWGVTINVANQATELSGSTASVVVLKAKNLLTLNHIEFNEDNLWYNLNIQWVTRAIQKYQNVSLSSLLDIGIANY